MPLVLVTDVHIRIMGESVGWNRVIARTSFACTPLHDCLFEIQSFISYVVHYLALSDLHRIMHQAHVQCKFPLELVYTSSIVVISGSKSSSVFHMDCANPTNVSYISMVGCTCSSS
jgi:hypothetical protein